MALNNKVDLSISMDGYWCSEPVAQVQVRAVQDGNQVAYQNVPYGGSGNVACGFGAEVPNGDTTFYARGLNAAGDPVGSEISFFLHVDKQLTQAPASGSAV